MNYIIVQAGGKGSRMQILTRNKPKALVPINNLPLIFHLFKKFPNAKFIIIGDYKYDVLVKYLKIFADVNYETVCSSGHNGTCAGLQKALKLLPDNERFMLIWCDLILSDNYKVPETQENVIGISKNFLCRWRWQDNVFKEERSSQQGVAGHFIFKNKEVIAKVPEDGEFVRWLSDTGIMFEEQALDGAMEYGLYSEWNKTPRMRCRPFNRLTVESDRIVKEGIDEQGKSLAKMEVDWYKKVAGSSFQEIPMIYSYQPLSMELINGKNIYEYSYIPDNQKRYILRKVIECLKNIHAIGSVRYDRDSYFEAYIGKTYGRLDKIRDLVPFANESSITVNGKVCRNIFFQKTEVEKLVMQYAPKKFVFIHGDCTFSNIMLRNDTYPVLIDPRGYFGTTKFYGDAAYDWVKLYYSLVSNYDQFNLKKFSLDITNKEVKLDIASNNWEELEGYFFELLDGEVSRRQMKIFLAITWLSLTTYAWEDYDSICGAFYKGLYYLEEALEMESAYIYYEKTMTQLTDALKGISMFEMENLISECTSTLKSEHKVVVAGGKKLFPVCEKFVEIMVTLGLEACALHVPSVMHGDMGMIETGDIVIMVTQRGNSVEFKRLAELLGDCEGVPLWMMSCDHGSALADISGKKLLIPLEDERALWSNISNHSSMLYLIVLQTLAMQLAKRLEIDLTMLNLNGSDDA